MSQNADIVIIGGGVNGLATAYNLQKVGMKNILVIEKGYIGFGATGRCGAGIRQQWGLDENIILARESVKIFEYLSEELGFNIFFRQGGYLMLISDEKEYGIISRTIPRHNELGVRTVMLSPKEVSELVPGLNTREIIGGAYCPNDGTAYPYAVLWGYEEALRRTKVRILTQTTVRNITRSPGGSFRVVTNRNSFSAPRILNVAGARSKEIAAMLGIEIPTRPYRHEIAVTEPIKAFLDPMVISIKKGFYFSQSLRGEIVGGIGDDDEDYSFSTSSTSHFLFRYAAALREVFPALSKVRIIRQWAGLYDVSPDARPIIGSVDGIEGYYHACGFSGHGFMLSPIVARLLSEIITTGQTSIPIEGLSLNRFSDKELIRDPYVVG